jgi:hypothetical protein
MISSKLQYLLTLLDEIKFLNEILIQNKQNSKSMAFHLKFENC